MGPPTGPGSPAPIDRPILELLRSRLRAADFVSQAVVTDAGGHLELRVTVADSYYPETVERARLSVRWYTNDDFKIHYRETHANGAWECRWDRHPNPHNTRAHFHPPPAAATPGDDASWPEDHRAVLSVVLKAIEARIRELWSS